MTPLEIKQNVEDFIYYMTTREDGKQLTLNELYESDYFMLVEIELRYYREKQREKRKEELNIVGEIDPTDAFNLM